MVKKAPVMEVGVIWQTLPYKREIYTILKIDVQKNALIFQTTLDFDLDLNFPVFIKINFKNLIFKINANEYQSIKNQLVCTFPKEARAIESRLYNRTHLPPFSNLSLSLRAVSTQTALDIKVELLDISDIGLGIRVSSLNLDYFRRNKIFKIIEVCGRPHMENAMFEVRHISLKEKKNYIGIGLLGDTGLSDDFFNMLRDEMKNPKKK